MVAPDQTSSCGGAVRFRRPLLASFYQERQSQAEADAPPHLSGGSKTRSNVPTWVGNENWKAISPIVPLHRGRLRYRLVPFRANDWQSEGIIFSGDIGEGRLPSATWRLILRPLGRNGTEQRTPLRAGVEKRSALDSTRLSLAAGKRGNVVSPISEDDNFIGRHRFH